MSHNDLAGVRYGKHISPEGFPVEDIKKYCSLFINGHLHNSGFVDEEEQILNLGNLTGQNFSEDAFTYRHFCAILDTDTLELTFFENPYAFNFYKLELTTLEQLDVLTTIGPQAVVAISCKSTIAQAVKKMVEELTLSGRIVCSRISLIFESEACEGVAVSELASVDYLQQFTDYMLSHLNNSDILLEELSKIVL